MVGEWQVAIWVKTREARLVCEGCNEDITPHVYHEPEAVTDDEGRLWYWRVLFMCQRCGTVRQWGSVVSERKRIHA